MFYRALGFQIARHGVNRVFVYGSLKQGFLYHSIIAPYVTANRKGWIKGYLFDLGTYPGWVYGSGRVYGELFTVHPLNQALRALDALEEYHGPGNPHNEYQRVIVPVTAQNRTLWAWAYRYLGHVDPDRRVLSGVWAEHSHSGES